MKEARFLAGESVVPTGDPGVTARLRDLLAGEGLASRTVPGGRVIALVPRGSDPVRPVLSALLGERPLRARWGIGVAPTDAAARTLALAALDAARSGRRLLAVRTWSNGEPQAIPGADLDDRAAVLEALLAGATPRQGEIARRLLLDGRRQAEVAAELGVSRATISVAVARGRVAAIGAAHRLLAAGLRTARPSGSPTSGQIGAP